MDKTIPYKVNNNCKRFPCREGIPEGEFICNFCNCPLSHLMDCGGDYSTIRIKGAKYKDCSKCTTPYHKKTGIDFIMGGLKGVMK